MTQPEAPELRQEAGKTVSPTDAEAASDVPAPEPPEPWTAEKVVEWNAYYDLYVVLAVLLLAFVASANKISNSSLWTHLKVGQVISARGPLAATIDHFSYTEPGRRWVDVSWLFDW